MAASNPCRGDIFWIDIPQAHCKGSEQYGRRPALIVSADPLNSSLGVVIIVPLSKQVQKANRHFRILIPASQKIEEPGTAGCPGDSVALTEQVRIIDKSRLDSKRVAHVTDMAIASVETGLAYVLRIP